MASGCHIVKSALDRFKSVISSDDHRTFLDTDYKDLWEGIRAIEDEQGRRLDLRFMRRIEPFLVSMESYGPVIEVFSQGFSPMAFVWGPVKLILRLARQYTSVMEQILAAYADIADVLPRMDRLKTTFGDTPEFQQILGLIYNDIIEFHQRAYKMFRRKTWHIWFALDWGLFQRRFKSILSRLASHCDLLDKEAASIHFMEMKAMRDKRVLEEESFEQQRQLQMIQDIFKWLSAAEESQEEYLHRLSDHRQQDTCDYIFSEPRMSSWLDSETGPNVIWMTGIPGAGKSFLCTSIIQSLQSRHDQSTLYFFCGNRSAEKSDCGWVLQTLAYQLLQQNRDLCSVVHQAYIAKGSSKSSPALKRVLKDILVTVKASRIVLDGIDECEDNIQRNVISSLIDVQNSVGASCKILVSSRDEPLIKKSINRKEHISLDGKNTQSVNIYIRYQLSELKIGYPHTTDDFWDKIEHKLQDKAKGMFLWVRLVFGMLQAEISESGLEDAVDKLPDGLDKAYGRILSRIQVRDGRWKDRVFRILFWVCLAYRPVSIHEVADGITLKPDQTVLNKKTRPGNLDGSIVESCAPLLERSANGTLDLIHFSAKEYLLHAQSGPFVDQVQAHFHIALSCVINLNSALDVVPRYNNGRQESDFENSVVQAAYGLQAYGHQYWAEHTVAYLDSITDLDEQALTLVQQLHIFSRACKQLDLCDQRCMHGAMNNESPQLTLPLHIVNKFPSVRILLLKWFRFKAKAKSKVVDLEDWKLQEEWQLAEDETFLSLTDTRIRVFRERLLEMDASTLPSHINEVDHRAFVERFGFICRLLGCGHVFNTQMDRDSHEAGHTIFLPCVHCDFYGKGFKTRKALEHHVNTYHKKPEEFEIPPSLEAAGKLTNKPSARYDTSERPSQRSNCWNEQGRKVIRKTLGKLLSCVESEMTFMEETDLAALGTQSRAVTDLIPTVESFGDIRARIEAHHYQTLTEFKDDVHQVLTDPETLTISESYGDVGRLCDREVGNAAAAFPGFSNPLSTQSSPCKITTSPDTYKVGEVSIKLVENQIIQPYWAKPETAKLLDLLGLHGRDYGKISDQLRTKSPQDVEVRFRELVKSGRQDLAKLADTSDSKAQQDSEYTMLNSEIEPSSQSMSVNERNSETPEDIRESRDVQPEAPPAAFVVHPQELYDYRPQAKPQSNPALKPQPSPHEPHPAAAPRKYKRRPPLKRLCPYCKKKFRDDATLSKHAQRFHWETRKVWICEDVSLDKKMFGRCKPCSREKRYSTRHNAFKHLRGAHFTPTTPQETLSRWIKETEELNPNSDHQHTEWVKANHGDRLPAPWQANKRPKTGNESDSAWPRTPDGRVTLPPMRDAPDESNGLSRDFPSNDTYQKDHSPAITPGVVQELGSFQDPQAGLIEIDHLPPGMTFDNFLPGSAAISAQSSNSIPTGASQNLIRLEQIPRLPHLSAFDQAACADEVRVLYQRLQDESNAANGRREALERLERLSLDLYKGLTQWRHHQSNAPILPVSF